MKQDYLVLKNLVKTFDQEKDKVLAVDNLSLEVREGELVTLLGPSGCGKTTTLRMIGGFVIPTAGDVLIDGETVNTLPPNKRPTTMVFQNYALFPHMSVYNNVAYGLKIHREKKADIRRRVEEALRLVGLTGMASRSPAQLSGGQQQRVSLARSLIMEPKVLLLDEPLSNLDAKLRVSTRLEIRKLQQRLGITSVYVTHDQEEAMTLSDRVVIMHQGRIQQIGTPQDIYTHPANRFVADFIGKANFLNGRLLRLLPAGEAEVDIWGRRIQVPVPGGVFSPEQAVVLVVRPETVVLSARSPEALAGRIHDSVYLGSQVVYEVEVGEDLLTVEIADPQEHPALSRGEDVGVVFKKNGLHLLPSEEKAPPR
jgi:iron(III) transport system ATP-binding protein